MTDTATRTAGPEVTAPNTITALVPSDTPIGTPVRKSGTGTAVPARADSAADARCIGLLATAGAADTDPQIRYAGPLTLTTAEWDALTSDVGGLVEDDYYFLSQATAGKLTKTAPVSGIRAPIGVALSADTMLILISYPATVGA